jgi:hypothetical protein
MLRKKKRGRVEVAPSRGSSLKRAPREVNVIGMDESGTKAEKAVVHPREIRRDRNEAH